MIAWFNSGIDALLLAARLSAWSSIVALHAFDFALTCMTAQGSMRIMWKAACTTISNVQVWFTKAPCQWTQMM